MPSTIDTKLALFGFIGSAMAAQAAPFESRGFLALFGFAQLLAVIGYLASSLPLWAGWIDGTTLQRLTIVQGLLVAVLAGNVAFFLAVEYGLSQILSMMAAAAGGYGGDKFLMPLLNRVVGKVDK